MALRGKVISGRPFLAMMDAENGSVTAHSGEAGAEEMRAKPKFKINKVNSLFGSKNGDSGDARRAESEKGGIGGVSASLTAAAATAKTLTPVTKGRYTLAARREYSQPVTSPLDSAHSNALKIGPTASASRNSSAGETLLSKEPTQVRLNLSSVNLRANLAAQGGLVEGDMKLVSYSEAELGNRGISVAGRFHSATNVNWEDEEDWSPPPAVSTGLLANRAKTITNLSSATAKTETSAPEISQSGLLTTPEPVEPTEIVPQPAKDADETPWGQRKVTTTKSLSETIREAKEKGERPVIGRLTGDTLGRRPFAAHPANLGRGGDALSRFRIRQNFDDEPPTFQMAGFGDSFLVASSSFGPPSFGNSSFGGSERNDVRGAFPQRAIPERLKIPAVRKPVAELKRDEKAVDTKSSQELGQVKDVKAKDVKRAQELAEEKAAEEKAKAKAEKASAEKSVAEKAAAETAAAETAVANKAAAEKAAAEKVASKLSAEQLLAAQHAEMLAGLEGARKRREAERLADLEREQRLKEQREKIRQEIEAQRRAAEEEKAAKLMAKKHEMQQRYNELRQKQTEKQQLREKEVRERGAWEQQAQEKEATERENQEREQRMARLRLPKSESLPHAPRNMLVTPFTPAKQPSIVSVKLPQGPSVLGAVVMDVRPPYPRGKVDEPTHVVIKMTADAQERVVVVRRLNKVRSDRFKRLKFEKRSRDMRARVNA